VSADHKDVTRRLPLPLPGALKARMRHWPVVQAGWTAVTIWCSDS
jgi:hypothetical protein